MVPSFSRTAHAYSRFTTSGSSAVKAACSAFESRNRCTCASQSVNRGLSDYTFRNPFPKRFPEHIDALCLSWQASVHDLALPSQPGLAIW